MQYFYPTDTLVTAPEIIFFWVARMIMAGLEFRNEIPFKHVYFTSIIRDGQGRKMSKSLGNSPDPLDVIATYGADALRFTVLFVAPMGQDVQYENEKCEMGRNFANKIWNAGRFLLMHRDQLTIHNEQLPIIGSQVPKGWIPTSEDLSDTWILSRFNSTVKDVTDALENFRVNEAVKMVYEFLWKDFCDWYIEFVKNRLQETSDAHLKTSIVNRALAMYGETLKLLHPFMPFVTEELWQGIAERGEKESIMVSAWPQTDESLIDKQAEQAMEFLQDVIGSIRNIRNEMNIAPTKSVDLVVNCNNFDKLSVLESNKLSLQRLTRLNEMTLGIAVPKPGYCASAVVQGQEIFIPLKGLIDLDVERTRLQKEIERLEGQLRGVAAKLDSENFVSKAPADVLEKERAKRDNFSSTIEKLKVSLSQLQ